MAKEIKHFFISHYHFDEEHIPRLKALMEEYYDIRNYSVTSEKFNNAQNEEYIKYLLRPLIKASSVFVCLIGPGTHESKWVNWEIEQASKMGKKIIGIYTYGAKGEDIPEALKDHADAIVGWRKDKIKEAIEGGSTFENPDGSQWNSISSDRSTC